MEDNEINYKNIIRDCVRNKDNKKVFEKIFFNELIINPDIAKILKQVFDHKSMEKYRNQQNTTLKGDIQVALSEYIKSIKTDEEIRVLNPPNLKIKVLSGTQKFLKAVDKGNRSESEEIKIQYNKNKKDWARKHLKNKEIIKEGSEYTVLDKNGKEKFFKIEDEAKDFLVETYHISLYEIKTLNYEEARRNKPSCLSSSDEQKSEDSNTTIEDTIKSENNVEKKAEYNIYLENIHECQKEFDKILPQLEITKDTDDKNTLTALYAMVLICCVRTEETCKNLRDLMDKLQKYSENKENRKNIQYILTHNDYEFTESDKNGNKENISTIKLKKIRFIDNIIKECMKYSKYFRKKIEKRFSLSVYSTIIKFLINESSRENQNEKNKKSSNTIKKLAIPELIIDFNKIRNYLSVLLSDKTGYIKDKSTFIAESGTEKSSYEKDIRRILLLFGKKNIFEIKNELNSPSKILKVYETHTVPNLVSNFLLLDVLNKLQKKHNSEKVNLTTIVDELFPLSLGYNEEDIINFRKYNILPRLKELEKYGLVKIENDKYALKAKYLSPKQKKILEYVVPFFCGIYPFASIGHFLAKRLNIKDKFEFDSFNIVNLLDDCITFDLLSAINNNKKIVLNLKNKKNIEITPQELIFDNANFALKVTDTNKQEYYLKEIVSLRLEDNALDKTKKNKPNNLIFSEIYSMYYTLFEEMTEEYKNTTDGDIKRTADKHQLFLSQNDEKIFEKIASEIIPQLAKLDNISIPLTKLELQWLKTIMRDGRFDLFVPDEDKKSLENLFDDDVTPFDLSAFKVYNSKEKIYKNIADTNLPKVTDKEFFRKQFEIVKEFLFNIQDDDFKNIKTK